MSDFDYAVGRPTEQQAAQIEATMALHKRGVPLDIADKHVRLTLSNTALLSSLQHMQGCRSCAEGAWSDCEEGRAAEAAIKNAEALLL
jgi:hypothetical protein